MGRHYCLHNDLVDAGLKFCTIAAKAFKCFQGGGEGSLVADVIFVLVFVEYEVGAGFVDGVVGEVHPHVLLIGGIRFFIVGGRQPAHSFFVEVDLQRGQASQQHVESQVELESIDQQRVGYILLDHYFFLTAGFGLFGQINASALTVTGGFYNIETVWARTGKSNYGRDYFSKSSMSAGKLKVGGKKLNYWGRNRFMRLRH